MCMGVLRARLRLIVLLISSINPYCTISISRSVSQKFLGGVFILSGVRLKIQEQHLSASCLGVGNLKNGRLAGIISRQPAIFDYLLRLGVEQVYGSEESNS
jgi:hypothetical protein